MTTEIRVPIAVTGWVVLRDLQVVAVEVSTDYEFGPIPFTSPYGADTDVIVFRDPGETLRFEGSVDLTEPIRKIIEATDVPMDRWEFVDEDLVAREARRDQQQAAAGR